jgi:hypothetical protein
MRDSSDGSGLGLRRLRGCTPLEPFPDQLRQCGERRLAALGQPFDGLGRHGERHRGQDVGLICHRDSPLF